MEIVIIGDGKVGSTLCRLLRDENHNIVLIDSNPDILRDSMGANDVMCIEGNGASHEIQLEAGVDKSDLVIACTSKDELNMLCCLLAKKLGAKKTVARVRAPEYFKNLKLIQEDLGLSMAINPELDAANEIARLLILPSATKVELFAKGRVELVEYKIPSKSPINNISLKELYKKYKIQLLICAVSREDRVYIPDGEFKLRAGDKIYITATHRNIENFFKLITHSNSKVKTVIIIGGGRICYYLALKLADIGIKVKIIEKDMEKCTQLIELLPRASVINGDGTDRLLLHEEGLEDADAIVALTGMDEENIIISLFASTKGAEKVITKINRDSYMEIALKLGIERVISPKQIAADNILSYVRAMDNSYGSNIETMYQLVDGRVEALEFRVKSGPGFLGAPLKELKLKKNVLIACIVRDRQIIIPNGDDCIKAEDTVVLVTTEPKIHDLKEILADA